MKKTSSGKLVKGLSIDEALYKRAVRKAQAESRSFSAIVCLAIERDLREHNVQPAEPKPPVTLSPEGDDLIDTHDVAQILKLSVHTVRKRMRRKGDPIRTARSRLGKKKPMQFHLSKIRELERASA